MESKNSAKSNRREKSRSSVPSTDVSSFSSSWKEVVRMRKQHPCFSPPAQWRPRSKSPLSGAVCSLGLQQLLDLRGVWGSEFFARRTSLWPPTTTGSTRGLGLAKKQTSIFKEPPTTTGSTRGLGQCSLVCHNLFQGLQQLLDLRGVWGTYGKES